MKTWVKVTLGVLAVPLLAGGAFAGWVASHSNSRLNQRFEVAPVELSTAGDVARGQHVVMVRNGCADCHGADLAGASVMDNPAMGKIYASNLTPAALGAWSDGEIARAIRHGVGRDRQPLVLMPAHDYIHLSEADLSAAVAYLRSIPPVEKANENTRLGPVSRSLLALNQAPLLPAEMLDHQRAFPPEPVAEVSENFGQYLAQTACMGCHGPQLRGGPIPGGDPSWPPASNIRRPALADWNETSFIGAMRSGITPSGQEMRSPMPWKLIGQYTETELKALWMYLKSLE